MFEEGGCIFSQSAAPSCTSFATVVLPKCHMPLHKEHTCALLCHIKLQSLNLSPLTRLYTRDAFTAFWESDKTEQSFRPRLEYCAKSALGTFTSLNIYWEKPDYSQGSLVPKTESERRQREYTQTEFQSWLSLFDRDSSPPRELEFFNLWEKITLHIIQDSLQIEEGNAYNKLNTNPSM